ncbi:hypothetical protein AB0M43_28045 [Longispora sp. NPDC051575]|uniref:hypothetical protein n=1 Tax=Longispora sp. NPDC051575 TaxID=3154943 RepID=UPI0034317E71
MPAPPAQPVSSATRHLSAAAYLDQGFRRVALAEIYHGEQRFVAPSYGFDLPTVLAHCLTAQRITAAQDGCLLAGLLLFALIDWDNLLRTLFVVGFGLIVMFVGLLVEKPLAKMLVVVLGYTSLLIIVINTIFPLPLLGAGSQQSHGGVLVMLLILFGVVVGTEFRMRAQLDRLAPGAAVVQHTDQRLRKLAAVDHGNLTVYAGYRPFIGSGFEIGTWSFAQRLMRAGDPLTQREQDREFDTAPFTTLELKEYVTKNLFDLAFTGPPELRLPGLDVTDRVFVACSEITNRSQVHSSEVKINASPSRPPVLSPAALERVIANPTGPARHYLSCQVVSWDGEVVTTVYVHFAVQGRTLYLELSAWALPPCAPAYRSIDDAEQAVVLGGAMTVFKALAGAPMVLLKAPINLARLAMADRQGGAARSNYGARISLRELGDAGRLRAYQQEHDVEKYSRIIERRVLAAVYDFLEDKDIDVSEYTQRAMTILNNGVINTGGTTTLHSTAVGSQATTINRGGGK